MLRFCLMIAFVSLLSGCKPDSKTSDAVNNQHISKNEEGMNPASPDDIPNNGLLSGGIVGNTRLIKPAKTTSDKHKNFITIARISYRLNERHPAVLAAQWALESRWGERESGKNNYFGIKAKKGETSTRVATKEEYAGVAKSEYHYFKNYSSLEESIADRIALIKRVKSYVKAGYFDAANPHEAIVALKKGGYATDAKYVLKLVTVIAGVRYQDKKLNPYQPLRLQIPMGLEDQDINSPTRGSGVDARGLNSSDGGAS